MQKFSLFSLVATCCVFILSGCSLFGSSSGGNYIQNAQELVNPDLPVSIIYPQNLIVSNRARRSGEFFDGVISDESSIKNAVQDATQEIFNNVSVGRSGNAKLLIEVRGVSIATRRSGEYFAHMEVKLKSPTGNVFTSQSHEDDLDFGEPMNRDAIYATNKSAYINALMKALEDIVPMMADIESSGSTMAVAPPTTGMRMSSKEGTAFFLNKQGNLIANSTFVSQCRDLKMWFQGREYPVNVVMSDPAIEVSVLSSSVVPRITAVFKSAGDASSGESVIAVGYTNDGSGMSRTPSILQGTVVNTSASGDRNYMQLSMQSQSGNQGAPVVASSGHVVGMLSDGSISVKGDTIKQYLSRMGINYRFHAGATRRFDLNRLVNHARGYTVKLMCN